MGKLLIAQQFGNNVVSDEITATKNDVVKGKTTITSDSGDEIVTGTLELTGTSSDEDVLANKTYYNTDLHTKRTGKLADNSATTLSATPSLDSTNKRIQMTIPKVGKYSTTSKLYSAYSTICSLIGLTAAKLANGQNILGLTGTYKGLGNAIATDVRKGKTFSTASLSNATGTMAEKAAATYTPKTTNQTIAANQFLTGTQTIKGDANLVAGNIKSDVSIFGVKGTQKWINECAHVDLFNGTLSFTSTEKSLSLGNHETSNWIQFEVGLTSPNSYSGYGVVMCPVGIPGGGGGFLRLAGSVYAWVNVERVAGGATLLKYNMTTGSSRNVGIYVRKVAVTNGDINGWA